MRITYDEKTDLLVIDLDEAASAARSAFLAPNSSADLDERGRLIRVVVASASGLYDRAHLRHARANPVWLQLADAAEESGLSHSTLRQLIHSGRIAGRKVGRDWQVARAVLQDYLLSRAPSGRPAKAKKARRR